MTSGQRVLLGLALLGGCLPAHAKDAGPPVAGFTARTLQGEVVSLDEALRSHRAVAVVFLSTVCPYARSFAPHLQELQDQYGARGLMILGVYSNRTETAEEVSADVAKRGYGFPVIKDEHQEIANALGARVTPESFLIGASARLRYRGRVRSKLGATELRDAVDAVLAGRDPRTRVAKAFGCAIVRD